MRSGSVIVVLVAAGAGERLGAEEPKAFLPIGDRPILGVAATAAAAPPDVAGLVVAVPEGWEERALAYVEPVAPGATFVTGGSTRQGSVRAGLAAVPDDASIVVVHDAVRPFASPALFGAVIEVVGRGGDGAVPVLPLTDTVLRVEGRAVAGVEVREELALAQTPQAFRTAAVREAHDKAQVAGVEFTDDASVLAWAGFEVRTVPGDPGNMKITTLADLAEADRRMRGQDG
jgi:2-C-methyl-D-erythritol 4-phosphate cytidylyltransferase/2-C-methyl-D-erythritol 2,4-cyclodiphosphate synthase